MARNFQAHGALLNMLSNLVLNKQRAAEQGKLEEERFARSESAKDADRAYAEDMARSRALEQAKIAEGQAEAAERKGLYGDVASALMETDPAGAIQLRGDPSRFRSQDTRAAMQMPAQFADAATRQGAVDLSSAIMGLGGLPVGPQVAPGRDYDVAPQPDPLSHDQLLPEMGRALGDIPIEQRLPMKLRQELLMADRWGDRNRTTLERQDKANAGRKETTELKNKGRVKAIQVKGGQDRKTSDRKTKNKLGIDEHAAEKKVEVLKEQHQSRRDLAEADREFKGKHKDADREFKGRHKDADRSSREKINRGRAHSKSSSGGQRYDDAAGGSFGGADDTPPPITGEKNKQGLTLEDYIEFAEGKGFTGARGIQMAKQAFGANAPLKKSE